MNILLAATIFLLCFGGPVLAAKEIPAGSETLTREPEDPPICRSLYKEACRSRKFNDGIRDRRPLAQKVRSIFPRIKKLLIERINATVVNNQLRQALVRHIDKVKIHVDSPACANVPRQFLGAAYNEGAIYVCGREILRENSSEFLVVQVLGHELSHAIAPCEVGKQGIVKTRHSTPAESQFHLPQVVSCLRGADSLEAQRGSCSGGRNRWIDQIEEAFADWSSHEILPEYMERYHPELKSQNYRDGYASIARSMCYDPPSWAKFPAQGGDGGGHRDVHPAGRRRIDFGLLTQPKVRMQMGCDVAPPMGRNYCSAHGPDSPGALQKPTAQMTETAR